MLVQGVGAVSFKAQHVVLINDELELPQSAEEFRGCINGHQVFLRVLLGVHSHLHIAHKALRDEVDCITSMIVNVHVDDGV